MGTQSTLPRKVGSCASVFFVCVFFLGGGDSGGGDEVHLVHDGISA